MKRKVLLITVAALLVALTTFAMTGCWANGIYEKDAKEPRENLADSWSQKDADLTLGEYIEESFGNDKIHFGISSSAKWSAKSFSSIDTFEIYYSMDALTGLNTITTYYATLPIEKGVPNKDGITVSKVQPTNWHDYSSGKSALLS